MKKNFLVMLGLIMVAGANSFAAVIVRQANGKSDQFLRAYSQSGVIYFQTCNLTGDICTPFGNPDGYSKDVVKKFQKRTLNTRLAELTGATVTIAGPLTIVVGMAVLGVFTPPVGIITVVGYFGAAGLASGAVFGGIPMANGFISDMRLANTLKIGQKGEDHVITVPSLDKYETDLSVLLTY